MKSKIKLIKLSVLAALAVSKQHPPLTGKAKLGKLMFSVRVVALGVSLAVMTPASAAPVTQEQTEQWQQDFQAQLKRQLGQQTNTIPTKSAMSPERMAQAIERVRHFATTEGAFQGHQIRKYCQKEMFQYCPGKHETDQALVLCLTAHSFQFGQQCKAVVNHGFQGEPTLTDTTHHDVLIPTGSRYYYISTDRSLGVALSRPSNYKGIAIKGKITWYDGGSIRSYVPMNTPVRYGLLTFAPNESIMLLPNGKIKQGMLYDNTSLGNQHFQAGTIISRGSDREPWVALN
ncbi:hypothetical protein AB6D66_00510 [Vibrio pomeroyi]|uniref:Uncharacterized protein n=1 Tax=Vibrio pomeroyi TaxID=198832 RepID=A0ABV4MQW3_9VIBR|nr:hypothetical protein [Vibrio atlanticus]MCZ4311031.1 hypothetical protein [Vibrio atlanticus]